MSDPSTEPQATEAAVAHAAATGVDLSTVEGTGAGGTITKADVSAAAKDGGWFYCLEARHPGANEVIHDSRFFQWTPGEGETADSCPVCPACGKQTTSVPAKADGVYPSGLLAVAERLV